MPKRIIYFRENRKIKFDGKYRAKFFLEGKSARKKFTKLSVIHEECTYFFNTHNIFKDSIAQAKAAAQNADRELPALPES